MMNIGLSEIPTTDSVKKAGSPVNAIKRIKRSVDITIRNMLAVLTAALRTDSKKFARVNFL